MVVSPHIITGSVTEPADARYIESYADYRDYMDGTLRYLEPSDSHVLNNVEDTGGTQISYGRHSGTHVEKLLAEGRLVHVTPYLYKDLHVKWSPKYKMEKASQSLTAPKSRRASLIAPSRRSSTQTPRRKSLLMRAAGSRPSSKKVSPTPSGRGITAKSVPDGKKRKGADGHWYRSVHSARWVKC